MTEQKTRIIDSFVSKGHYYPLKTPIVLKIARDEDGGYIVKPTKPLFEISHNELSEVYDVPSMIFFNSGDTEDQAVENFKYSLVENFERWAFFHIIGEIRDPYPAQFKRGFQNLIDLKGYRTEIIQFKASDLEELDFDLETGGRK